MDFFASQELARRKTRWLIFWFILSLICMIAVIYAVVVLVTQTAEPLERAGIRIAWFDPLVLGGVAAAVLSVVGLGSLSKIVSLRGGGESVAAMLGGRLLPPNANEPAERRILNVVEEMALAAGTPVPPVYILDNEHGINAFAAGYTVDDAVIGINRGTIEQLNRDELQGVVAHEFSHILNGDMRMNIRMIGILFGIQLLALVGYYVLRGSAYGRRSSNDKGGGAIILIALALIVVGSIGLFFARLIKASVSRQREYLADASAVQFTRNPNGIAGALKMIAVSSEGSQVHAPQAEETSHMFFGSMYPVTYLNIFATHPPLLQRIQKLDPQFDGNFDEYRRQRERRRQHREPEARPVPPPTPAFPQFGQRGGLPGMLGDQFPVDPLILVAGIGLPDDDDMEYSEFLVDRIPPVLAEAARDVFSARCVVFASLLNRESGVREQQMQAIARLEGSATIDETRRLVPLVEHLELRCRLPVFEILQGSLTAMSPEQYDSFRKSVDVLVAADHRIDLFEFFLRHHLIVHLDRRYGRMSPPRIEFRSMQPLKSDILQLLEILVRVGHTDVDVARLAFQAAIDALGVDWDEPSVLAGQPINYRSLTTALGRLNAATPAIKKRALTAAAIAITCDGQVTVQEAELFRAMSESLDCPVPPVVATISRQNGSAP